MTLEPMELEDQIEQVKSRTERRGQLDNDRRDGALPIAVDTIGDLTAAWMSTGVIANGASVTVYLTRNCKAGGDSLFRKVPISVKVYEDAVGTGGGMERSSGPIGPSAAFELRDNNDFVTRVKWIASNEVWGVIVTNNTGSSCDFAVHSVGF